MVLPFSSVSYTQQIDFEAILQREGVTLEEYEELTAHYYLSPQQDKLISIIRVMISQEDFINDTPHFMPFAHFVATVAYNDNSFFSELQNLANNYKGIQRTAIEEMIYQAENFQSPPPDSLRSLDYLWAEFSATGSEEPVRKIISVLDYQEPEKGRAITNKDMDALYIFGAARWSLKSNAIQHRRVYEIIKEELKSAHGTIKERLERMINFPEVKQKYNQY